MIESYKNSNNDENQIDFCWGVPHENLHNCYSDTVINSTAQQAFIAGYREGVKMSTDKGKPIPAGDFKSIWPTNLRILSTWCTVGADVENGKFAILGARMGCYSTTVDSNEWIQIRDLDKMVDLYENAVIPEKIDEDLKLYGESIRQRIDLPVAELDEYQSKFLKYVYPPHQNRGVQDREYK